MASARKWISTEEAAVEAGMSPEWVRREITAGRLRATVWFVRERRTFRISLADWREFRSRYSRTTDDADWG